MTIIFTPPSPVMANSAPQQTFGSTEARTAFAGNNFSGNNQFTIYGQYGNKVILESPKDACLRSLGFSGMHSRQQDIIPAEPDTCDWLFVTQEFRGWRDPDRMYTHHGVLWIKGKPGTGKSTLMKHAFHRYQDDFFEDHLIVAYFFNARGDKLERSPLGFLRSIVYQLIERSSELCELFWPLLERKNMFSNDVDKQWRLPELQEFLRSIIRKRASPRPLLLLVDALDECDESDLRDVVRFLESLADQAMQTSCPLRICLSSRHYPNIWMVKCVELVVERNLAHQEDIEKYIRERLRTPDAGIQAQIAKRADSIFLWVVIVVSLLNKVYDEGRVEEMQQALTDIPDGLERIFSDILRTVTYASETLAILQWVLLSERPLELQELFAAVTQVSTSDIEVMKRRITTSSKGLVEMRNDGSQTVQFIHLSIRDFLFRQQRLRLLDPTLGEDPIAASHGQLWARCRDSFEKAITTKTNWDDLKQAKDEDLFLEYAADRILDHAEQAIVDTCRSEHSHQQVCIEQWLQRSDHWFGWWKAFMRARNPYPDFRHRSEAGLPHLLARHGLLNLLRISLVRTDVDVQDLWHGTVLQAACHEKRNHSLEVIEWLIAEGADVNARYEGYSNALQIAAHGGSRDTVELLLAAGANVNAQGGHFGNALQAAASHGDRETIEILLDAGAHINAQGGFYGTALQAAAICRQGDHIELFIDAGAHVNAHGGYFGNALQAAASRGQRETVIVLLGAGANVNAQGGCFNNALQAAASAASREICDLLLGAGAKANAQGGLYGNALQAAALRGSQEIVQSLLKAGADVNAQGGYFENALNAATHHGSREIVQLLLNAGADINAQSREYGNALQVASCRGHQDIVKILLCAGADVHIQCGRFGNALRAARSSKAHKKEIIKLLLAAG